MIEIEGKETRMITNHVIQCENDECTPCLDCYALGEFDNFHRSRNRCLTCHGSGLVENGTYGFQPERFSEMTGRWEKLRSESPKEYTSTLDGCSFNMERNGWEIEAAS